MTNVLEILLKHILRSQCRHEMPVPFKSEVLEALSSNYESALKHTLSLRRKAAKNPELKQILLDTFAELLREEWLVALKVIRLMPKHGTFRFLLLNLLNQELYTTGRQLRRVYPIIRLYWLVKIC